MLLMHRVVPDVLAILKPEDFYAPKHQLIYKAIMELDAKGQEPDPILVCDILKTNGTLKECDGFAYVHALVTACGSATRATQYAAIVKKHSTDRKLTAVMRSVTESESASTPEETIAYLQDALLALEQDSTEDAVSLAEILGEHFTHLEKIARSDKRLAGIASNLIGLDDILSGFEPSTLTILAARPAMGKTALALCMMKEFAINMPDKAGLLFSLEMAQMELTTRMVSAHCKINSHKLKTGDLTTKEWATVTQAHSELANLNLYIDDQPSLTMAEIRARARRLHRRKGLSSVFVDYLQLVKPGRHFDMRDQEVSEVSQGLKNLAKELKVPVIALAQLNRQVEGRTDKRPVLSDLRDSGTIEQDADVCIFLYRDEYYNPRSDDLGIVELLVRKNRNGPTGDCKLAFVAEHGRFLNLAKGQRYASQSQPPRSYPCESKDGTESREQTEGERQLPLD
jgi:replicative DNA helicase